MIKIISKHNIFNNIDCVLFDKDGTLIDLHSFWGKITELRALETIHQFNLAMEDLPRICFILGYDYEKKRMISDGITALYSRSKIIEIFVEKLKDFGIITTYSVIETIFDNVTIDFNKIFFEFVNPIEDAIELVKQIKLLGIKTGIITADSIETTNLTIKNLGWENLFDIVIGRESSNFTKESGKPTKLALNQLNISPLNSIMIGDAPTDAISANNADIKNVILVSTGQVDKKELKKYSNCVLDSLKDLECLKI